MVAIGLGLVVLGAACGCFDRRGEPLDVQRSRTGLRRTLRAERLAGHHATSIITGAKIVGVASGRDLCPRAHDGACRSDIVGRVVLLRPEANGLLLSTPAAVPSACPSRGHRRSPAVNHGARKTGSDLTVRRRNRIDPRPESAFQARVEFHPRLALDCVVSAAVMLGAERHN